MRYIDLTRKVGNGMAVYPGDPAPRLEQVCDVEREGFRLFELAMGLHTGTHMDGPAHLLRDAPLLSDLPPERFFARGIAFDVSGRREITPDSIGLGNVRAGDAVLFCTGWGARFGAPEYFTEYPVLHSELAAALVEKSVGMVGMDTPSPDTSPFAIHRALMENGILILENLTHLEPLIEAPGFELFALPLRTEADSAPVRVVTRLP